MGEAQTNQFDRNSTARSKFTLSINGLLRAKERFSFANSINNRDSPIHWRFNSSVRGDKISFAIKRLNSCECESMP